MDLRNMKEQEAGENYIIRNFTICIIHQISNEEESGIEHVARMGEMIKKFRRIICREETTF
jgi:hypothetical protein